MDRAGTHTQTKTRYGPVHVWRSPLTPEQLPARIRDGAGSFGPDRHLEWKALPKWIPPVAQVRSARFSGEGAAAPAPVGPCGAGGVPRDRCVSSGSLVGGICPAGAAAAFVHRFSLPDQPDISLVGVLVHDGLFAAGAQTVYRLEPGPAAFDLGVDFFAGNG